MSKRKKKLRAEIGPFLRQYARKAYPGRDPNDRPYDRRLEERISRMKPEELDELMNGLDDEAP